MVAARRRDIYACLLALVSVERPQLVVFTEGDQPRHLREGGRRWERASEGGRSGSRTASSRAPHLQQLVPLLGRRSLEDERDGAVASPQPAPALDERAPSATDGVDERLLRIARPLDCATAQRLRQRDGATAQRLRKQ